MNTIASVWLALNMGATTPLPPACQADVMSYELARRCDAAFAGRVQAFERTDGGAGDHGGAVGGRGK